MLSILTDTIDTGLHGIEVRHIPIDAEVSLLFLDEVVGSLKLISYKKNLVNKFCSLLLYTSFYILDHKDNTNHPHDILSNYLSLIKITYSCANSRT